MIPFGLFTSDVVTGRGYVEEIGGHTRRLDIPSWYFPTRLFGNCVVVEIMAMAIVVHFDPIARRRRRRPRRWRDGVLLFDHHLHERVLHRVGVH